MYYLESKIPINPDNIAKANLCASLSERDLECLGNYVLDNYKRDIHSREAWTRRSEAALDLAMQVQKEKSFPWPNCSNIAFPLITIAAMQFHARAYPAIINGNEVVRCKVIGPDPQGIGKARADNIAKHMSWQMLEQDETWEEDTDRALLNVAIVGCGFKKTYFDASKGHPVSIFVQAKDLVVNYWARSIESAAVKTHIIPLYRNDVYERVRRGQYRDILQEAWFQSGGTVTETQSTPTTDNRAGLTRPDDDHDTPFIFLEQHCYFDFDGDGYAEPVIITVEETTGCVVKVAFRFNRIEDVEYNARKEIVRIDADEYFTKIPFVPSPDGGLLDYGFGVLIGPLNESVNSSINQLFDAGTLSNTAGGFLGRGAKIRGGVYTFRPFEWNRIDSSGDDLRKSIVPLPVREPSAVMFNLLNMLIEYTNRIAGSTDMMVGENPGQNTPAETSRNMTEQGQKIYSAIFKRIWRSMKREFKKIYNLNATLLPSRVPFGDGGEIGREEYAAGAMSVVPVADPTISSDSARFAQATMLKAAAAANPAYDADAVEVTYLRALGISNIEEVYKGVANAPEPAPDVRVQIAQLKLQGDNQRLQIEHMWFIAELQETQRLNEAKINELMAKASKLEIDASTTQGNTNITAFRAGIEAMRELNNNRQATIDAMLEGIKNGSAITIPGATGGAVQGLDSTSGNPALMGLTQGPPGGTEGGMG